MNLADFEVFDLFTIKQARIFFMNARVLDLSSEEICQETHLTRLIYTTLYRARL